MRSKAIPIFLVFLIMGFGDAVGPFVGLAKETFHLSNTVAQLIPFVGFLMFGLLSVPMGIFQDRKGKKTTLLLGLLLAFIGLTIPVFTISSYLLFLVTIVLLGAGAAVLQVAGNPAMHDVSPEGSFSSNLSFAQFIKAIGSLSTAFLPVIFNKYFNLSWTDVFPVYSITILITIVVLLLVNLDEKKNSGSAAASFSSCFSLLKEPFVLWMVLGIFFYVGAEVSVSSGVPIYLRDRFGIDIQKSGLAGTGLFFLALMTGRFLGGIILRVISPAVFLRITSFISVLGLLGLLINNSLVSFISAIVIGLGFANIFPLIFSIAIDRMPDRSNELSGLMVTAILGGALIPPVMGAVADKTSSMIGFIVPLLCILYIGWLSLNYRKL
ncbi:MAG: sugar MFS transporter [Bacteroidales bacterium]|nr:sugar MFS transporter [Bacteroidales bacterium]